MAGRRRAPTDRAATIRWLAIATVLLGITLIGIRYVPGTPWAPTMTAGPGSESSDTAGTAAGGQPASRSNRPVPTPTLPPLPLQPTTVELDVTGWWAWSLLDTRTGRIAGSKSQSETSTTASMIKVWIAADYLRRTTDAGREPSRSRLNALTSMVRDSDNATAESLYREMGRVASIKRLLDICELTDSNPAPDGGWSRTALSPRDTARMGACIADGRAAGPEWTEWLLEEMRAVRGVGDFGIRKAFPTSVQKTIAIKNGWVDRTAEQEYHVSCLAIGDGWTMSVLTRYPIRFGYTYGAKTCENVASQLRVT